MLQRRVVVTGLGLVTPLGLKTGHVWNRILAGHSGISLLDTNSPSKVAAIVPRGTHDTEYDASAYFTKSEQRQLSSFIQYALVAAQEALLDAKWNDLSQEQKDATVSGIGSVQDAYEASIVMESRGMKRVNPFFIPKLLANMAAGHVSIKYGFTGPNHAPATACTAGCHAIGDAMNWIKLGLANVVVAGGAESSVNELAMAGFSQLRALSTNFNNDPERASRPFDINRDGFVIGEGSGILVLEELEHARNRNAHIYCEIVGYGMSGDANHITAPSNDGKGAQMAMERALKMANMDPQEIDHVNAHATSTPLGDLAEAAAIYNVLGRVPVTSTKGAIGHLLGAGGAVEAIFAIKTLETKMLPPTRNLDNLDPKLPDLDFVKETRKITKTRATMTNSFGFGGTNATLVFKNVSE